MTNPHRTITAIIGIAEQLSAHLGAHMGVELALASDLLRAGSLSGGGRSSDVPDPTGTLATTLTSRGHQRDTTSSWPEFCEDAERALLILRRMQTRQAACIRQDPDTARDADATARALRCDGSVDPLCLNNAVKGGLCWKCIKRRQRAGYETSGQVSQDLLETDISQPCAPVATAVVVTGTCGRCGHTVHGSDPDDIAGQLARHHTYDCVA